jgi:hypothetical protein
MGGRVNALIACCFAFAGGYAVRHVRAKEEVRRITDLLRIGVKVSIGLSQDLERAKQEIAFTHDRGDHVIYRDEWEAFDRWQREVGK